MDAVASIPVLHAAAVKPAIDLQQQHGVYGLHPLEPTEVPAHSSWGQVLRAGLATAASVRHDRQAAKQLAAELAGSQVEGGAGSLSTELLFIPATDVFKLKVSNRLGSSRYCMNRSACC
jgi:hypothetical protein